MISRTQGIGKQCLLDMATDTQLSIAGFAPTNFSSEASAPSYTQSTSSTIISPGTLDPTEALCESSAQSGSTSIVKEQDYMGMSDTLPAGPKSLSECKEFPLDVSLNEDEPDLRLALGLSSVKAECDHAGLHPLRGLMIEHARNMASHTLAEAQDSTKNTSHSSRLLPQYTGDSLVATEKKMDIFSPTGFSCSSPMESGLKNAKRLFSDTVYYNVGAGADDANASSVFVPGSMRTMIRRHEVPQNTFCKQSQTSYWGVSQAISRPSEPQHGHSSHLEATSMKFKDLSRGLTLESEDMDPDTADGPLSKEHVVGWPPVRSYRRSAINSGRSRSAGTEMDANAALYVKVNMAGIPIGRKVDLNAYRNYEELLSALEEMFSSHVGEGIRFLHARAFVLTYEDKEGDWMLVGDVPWGMFVNTVKRLLITRGSDTACLGPSASRNLL
ncbi:hypothetical protein KP509_29G020600 [Ceratopteris richardii]|uniref:Auxin-responsive protein n=1 Tax=Ceratopteris richardii TaxID=49495 RepID=A0A8T2R6X8_CERRI|nr:hypothetical protein KP509_29G020600 [Ceratopteris richardii]